MPSLREIAHLISAECRGPASTSSIWDTVVDDITLRAQEAGLCSSGSIFAAVPGTRVHGADFSGDAWSTGALAVLTDDAGAHRASHAIERAAADTPSDRPTDIPLLVVTDVRAALGLASSAIFGHPTDGLTVLAITGTSGKTTTSYLVEAGLTAAGCTVGLIGTTGTRLAGRPIPSALTTPEAPDLQRIFHMMRDEGVTHVVMEVSSHALDLGRVSGTRFDVAAFLNLSHDHLDFHPTMEDYFAAKARLFSSTAAEHAHRAVICVDDTWGRRMLDVARTAAADLGTPAPVSVALSGTADYYATDLNTDGGTQDFHLHSPDGATHRGHLGFPGSFNVANTLVAAALIDAIGIDIAAALRGIATVGVPGRLERVVEGQDFVAVVDYAHKPGALRSVLETVRADSTGRIGLVVGCGGDRDKAKRPLMAQIGAEVADLLVITDDNPRSEDPAAIRADMLAGLDVDAVDCDVRDIGDRAEAIAAAVAWARPGDTVVVAGKGHETGQAVGDVVYPFDDRQVLAEALRSRG